MKTLASLTLRRHLRMRAALATRANNKRGSPSISRMSGAISMKLGRAPTTQWIFNLPLLLALYLLSMVPKFEPTNRRILLLMEMEAKTL